MNRIKILLLAYDYPPRNTIGAQRPASWVKYFDPEIFDVTVIAGPWGGSGNSVIYAEGKDPGGVKYNPYFTVFRKALSLLRLVGSFQTSLLDTKYSIYELARRELNRSAYDLILATAEPFILFKYAHDLSAEFGIPWVADYRDPWSNEKSVRERSRAFAFLNDFYTVHIERKLLKTAASITTAGLPYKVLIKSLHPDKEVAVVPNGYDLPDSFMRRLPSKDRLVFCYLGRLYPHRNFRIFLDGLSDFVNSRANPAVEVRFYGLKSFEGQCEQVVSYAPVLEPFLKFHDLKPYAEVMNEAQDCHICLMFSDGKSNFTPGKLYDYVGLNRKIWLSPPDGGFLNQLIIEKKLGQVFSGKEDILKAINEAYASFENEITADFYIESSEEFSRKHAALRMQAVIKNVVDRHVQK